MDEKNKTELFIRFAKAVSWNDLTIIYCNTWETPSIQYNNFFASFTHEASHGSKTSASTTPQFNWKTKETSKTYTAKGENRRK